MNDFASKFETPSQSPEPQPRSRRRRWFILLAIVVGFVPLVILEVALRLGGVAEEERYQDPLVGFSRVSPLFEKDDREDVYRTSRSRQVLFELQEFAIQKPENGYRVFCLGGSTVRGRPYTAQTAFSRWLELELSARDPDHTYDVVNCGGLSYASYRLTHILEEVLEYEPNLIVIATGHNEFLEDRTYDSIKHRSRPRAWVEDRLNTLRTVRLLQQWQSGPIPDDSDDERTTLPDLVDARLDQASGYASYHRDDAWVANVAVHFERSLRAMVQMCGEADVPVVLVRLGSNVRDCPPFKSEHRLELPLEQERGWQASVEAAQKLAREHPEDALAELEAAAAIDDEYALLRFRMGRLLDRLGRTEEAAEHFRAARDLDVCPLRMTGPLSNVLRRVADDTQTPLIDAGRLIEADLGTSIAGNDAYQDHVHPSIGAHQLIGAALIARLTEAGIVSLTKSFSDDDRRELSEQHFASLGPRYLAEGYERVSWLEKWARRQRLHDDTLPTDLDARLRYGQRLWEFGKPAEAWRHYAIVLDDDPGKLNSLLDQCDRLFERGRRQEAIELLDRIAAHGVQIAEDEIDRRRQRFSAKSAP